MAATVRQMTAQALNALRGYHSNPHALIYQLSLHPSITTWFPAGTVMSRNGEYAVLGVGSEKVQAFYSWHPYDWVTGLYGSQEDPTDTFAATVQMPASKAKFQGLVSSAPYELITTNYVAGSYPPDTPLTSPRAPSSNAGKLVAGTHGTQTIVGIVSEGIGKNYGRPALAFWTCLFWPTA